MSILSKKKEVGKFGVDVIWNMASFVLGGIIGILLNVLILWFYDTEVLGVFNLVAATYFILSQIAVAGIHLSTQKYVPEYQQKQKTKRELVFSALFLVFICSTLVSTSAFFLRKPLANLLDSDLFYKSIVYVLPGLVFFSLNKVLLSYINGVRQMKQFAIFQFLRYFLMLGCFLFLIIIETDIPKLSGIFSLAEMFLFILISTNLRTKIKPLNIEMVLSHFPLHINFGSKSAIGHILLDMNTRIDVIMLGVFTEESSVGVYSFAASFAEAFSQLPYILRTNINPILSRCIAQNNRDLLRKVINKNILYFYKLLVPCAVLGIATYPIFLTVIQADTNVYESWKIFSILIAGITIAVGYIPFQMVLGQTGFPFQQTLFLICFVGTNFILNLILIPLLGTTGAALASSASFIMQVVCLKIFTKKILGITI